MESADVVVIGGGVIGSACAYHLARAGVQVTLLEKHEIASGASGGSAGGVRQQNRLAPELPIAMGANPMWKTLEEDLGMEVEYRRGGHITLVEREEDLPALEAAVQRQQSRGLNIRVVKGNELREIVPAVAPQVIAGSYSPTDGFANPILTTKAFAHAAMREGAKVLSGTEVTAIRRTGDRVDGVESTRGPIASRWVINAAGAWSPDLSAAIGVPLPICTGALQMMVTEATRPLLVPVLGCVGRNLSLKQMPQGQFVVGGGWPGVPDMVSDRGWPKSGSPNGSAQQVTAILPATLQLSLVRVWNSLEAKCIDDMPVLGTVDGVDGYLLATGFSGHGFALAPYVGLLMAQLIAKGETKIPLDQLNLRRFAGLSEESLRNFYVPLEPAGIRTGRLEA